MIVGRMACTFEESAREDCGSGVSELHNQSPANELIQVTWMAMELKKKVNELTGKQVDKERNPRPSQALLSKI